MLEVTTEQLREEVIQIIALRDGSSLGKLIEQLSSKEIIHLIGHLDKETYVQLIRLLTPEEAADVIEEIPETQAVNILEKLSSERAAAIIHEMESDHQADFIMELSDRDAQAILNELDAQEAASIRKLISYDYDTAGGLMHTEYLALSHHQSVESAVEYLRKNADEFINYTLKYIFIVNNNGLLLGVLQMYDLLLSQPETTLSKVIFKDTISVNHFTTLDQLIDIFHENNLYGLPVLNDNGVLIGIVLRKDVLEAQTERVTLSHLESQGIVGGDELRTMPVFLRAKRRLSWLSVNILLNILAASVIAYHQDVLTSVIALAVFLPIISDMSGCSGNQAVAVSMRELSIGAVSPKEVFRVWRQEISVGLINGLFLGVMIGAAAFLWKGNFYLSLVVGGALILNTLLAVSIGGTVPLILKGFNVDPAIASGPILTTITDMAGFFLTLTFASLLLSHIAGL